MPMRVWEPLAAHRACCTRHPSPLLTCCTSAVCAAPVVLSTADRCHLQQLKGAPVSALVGMVVGLSCCPSQLNTYLGPWNWERCWEGPLAVADLARSSTFL